MDEVMEAQGVGVILASSGPVHRMTEDTQIRGPRTASLPHLGLLVPPPGACAACWPGHPGEMRP